MAWSLYRNNTSPLQPAIVSDNLNFNWAALAAQWNQLLSAIYTGITPGSTQTVDFFSFVNQVFEATSFVHLAGFLVVPTGLNSICTIQPGASNPLTGLFRGTTPGIDIPPNGCFFISNDPAGVGLLVSATDRNLDFKNNGSGNLAFTIAALGSTT